MIEYFKRYIVPLLFFLALFVISESIYIQYFDGHTQISIVTYVKESNDYNTIVNDNYIIFNSENGVREYYYIKHFINVSNLSEIWDLLLITVTLIVTLIAIIMPISIYFLKKCRDKELSEANSYNKHSKTKMAKAKKDWKLKLSTAYADERVIILREFSDREKNIKQQEISLLEMKNTLSKKIQETDNIKLYYAGSMARKDKEHKEEILGFKKRELFLIKNRDSTFAAFNRIKKKKGIPIKNPIPQDPYKV